MIEKINQALKNKYGGSYLGQVANAAYVCDVAKKVGSSYQFIVLSFNSGILEIAVDNNIVAQEVRFKEKEIIERINNKLGVKKIKRIRYQVK